MPQRGRTSNQPSGSGEIKFRILKDGRMSRSAEGAARAAPEIKAGERFVTATLRGDKLDVRIGAGATVGGRPINREFEISDELEEIRDALQALLDEAGQMAEDAAMQDARQIAEATE